MWIYSKTIKSDEKRTNLKIIVILIIVFVFVVIVPYLLIRPEILDEVCSSKVNKRLGKANYNWIKVSKAELDQDSSLRETDKISYFYKNYLKCLKEENIWFIF